MVMVLTIDVAFVLFETYNNNSGIETYGGVSKMMHPHTIPLRKFVRTESRTSSFDYGGVKPNFKQKNHTPRKKNRPVPKK